MRVARVVRDRSVEECPSLEPGVLLKDRRCEEIKWA